MKRFAMVFLAGTMLATPVYSQTMSMPTPGGGGGGIVGAIKGLFGGGDATLELQLLQQAELLKEVENGLRQIELAMQMLEGFELNASGGIFELGGALQGVLYQADNLIARHGQITGYIDELYPEELSPNDPISAIVELARRQHREGRQRQIDSANVQAELFAAMELARVRDRDVLDESHAAEGLRGVQQATNQLIGGLNQEVRGLQTAMISHQRVVEDSILREDSTVQRAIAQKCKSLEGRPPARIPEYCR